MATVRINFKRTEDLNAKEYKSDLKKDQQKYSAKRRTTVYEIVPKKEDRQKNAVKRGAYVLVRPQYESSEVFEAVITKVDTKGLFVLEQLHPRRHSHHSLVRRFKELHKPRGQYEVRFLLNRYDFENMHAALGSHLPRMFPEYALCPKFASKQILSYFNKEIEKNEEQKNAVWRIAAGAGSEAPFLLVGPPGTGKTATLVEAVLQVVAASAAHRVLVCAPSNAAADHVACLLVRAVSTSASALVPASKKFLFRANSLNRDWDVMPPELFKHSNKCDERANSKKLMEYRVVVTTLLHAACYTSKPKKPGLVVTHVFVDEAAQAPEPACLVPLNLLTRHGCLVLCGDTKQLGPVCISHKAKLHGLERSLMERLMEAARATDTSHLVMLRNNYRSHPDILRIPNSLFYNDRLRAMASPDPLSGVALLGAGAGGAGPLVFHAVDSHEQKDKSSTSYYNEGEIKVLQFYIRSLIKHCIPAMDIGVVTPYAKQVQLLERWFKDADAAVSGLEVGSVETFQGREKRVLLVSTVRSNKLGFVADDKRFNVTMTRAKAKIIVVGNEKCLKQNANWRAFLEASIPACILRHTDRHKSVSVPTAELASASMCTTTHPPVPIHTATRVPTPTCTATLMTARPRKEPDPASTCITARTLERTRTTAHASARASTLTAARTPASTCTRARALAPVRTTRSPARDAVESEQLQRLRIV